MKFSNYFLMIFLCVSFSQVLLAMEEYNSSDADTEQTDQETVSSSKKKRRVKRKKKKHKKKYRRKLHTSFDADGLDEDLAGDDDIEMGNLATLNEYHVSELFKRSSFNFSLKRQQELRKLLPKTLQRNPQLARTARSALRQTRSEEDILETVQQANEFFGPLVEQLLGSKDSKIGKQKKTIKAKGDREKSLLAGGGTALIAQTIVMIIILILRFTEC